MASPDSQALQEETRLDGRKPYDFRKLKIQVLGVGLAMQASTAHGDAHGGSLPMSSTHRLTMHTATVHKPCRSIMYYTSAHCI